MVSRNDNEREPAEGAADGFQIATRHITRQPAHQDTEMAPDELLQVNQYNVLLDEGGTHECDEGRGNGGGFLTPHG